MLIHDVSLLGLHVVFAVDRAGLVGEDGETHHGIYDVGYLRQIPGMQILCPASQAELEWMLIDAVENRVGPIAIRYPKGGDGVYRHGHWNNVLRKDAEVTIVTYGTTINDVLCASERLTAEGRKVDIIKLDQIAPLEIGVIAASVATTDKLLVVEETADLGCIGHEIFSALCRKGIFCKGRLLNLDAGIVPHGDLAKLKAMNGMDAQGIYQKAKELLNEE